MSKISCIYKILNLVNGKFYIGSTKNFRKRRRNHLSRLRNNKHENIHLQRSWNKYGEHSFDVLIIEETTDLLIREQYYLDNLKPHFNIGLSACGGDTLTNHPQRETIIEKIKQGTIRRFENRTEEEKQRYIDNITGEKNPNYGNKWNDEQIKRASEYRKKHPPSEEHVQKMIAGSKRAWQDPDYKKRWSKNREGEGNSFYGKHHSEETANRIREAKKHQFFNSTPEERYNKNPQTRAVSIDGVIYFGVSEAARQLGVCPATIVFRIKSKNKKFVNYFYKD